MAHIRAHETSQKRKGRAVKRYEVVWREPVRDDYGLPVQENGKTKMRSRQESFGTREDAEARRDELNAAKHTGQTSALAEQRKAGDLPFGYYAQAWIESQQVKVAQGRLKQRTLDDYEKVLRRYSLERFGGQLSLVSAHGTASTSSRTWQRATSPRRPSSTLGSR